MPEKKFIKKFRLSDGAEYYVRDENAATKSDLDNYLPKTGGGTVTGDLTVDDQLSVNRLKVTSVDYTETVPENVLIQSPDGTIKKRPVDMLFTDMGGCTYEMDNPSGVLSFKPRTVVTKGCEYNMNPGSGVLSFKLHQ